MNTASHYTFGDGDVARDRLRLLAEAFEPSSRAFIARLPALASHPGEPALAVDLGCGAGYTTDLLRALPGVGRVVGIDRSPRLLDAARARLGSRAEIVEHDVCVAPLPLPPARLLYARFLLTHLRDVTQVLVGWRTALHPQGLVVLEETAFMTSEHPSLRRYYALVERMQAHYGQAMYIGRSLDEAARLAGLAIVDSRVAHLELPAARMARLHALNLRTWRDDPFAQASFEPTELAELSTTLGRIATGDEPTPAVSCGVKQLVLRRDEAGSSVANTKANATNPAQSAAR